jgi:hypothetical protein
LAYPLDRYPDLAEQKIIGTLLPVEIVVAGKNGSHTQPGGNRRVVFLRVDAFRTLNIEEQE